jgi:hypothetical protein
MGCHGGHPKVFLPPNKESTMSKLHKYCPNSKERGGEDITDFRPITLIHGFAKIVAKVLSRRLAHHMNDIISNARRAFIKNRSIHDNFMFVQWLHRGKKPNILFKIDTKKALDHVRWEYILETLQHLGFPPRFCDWIVA